MVPKAQSRSIPAIKNHHSSITNHQSNQPAAQRFTSAIALILLVAFSLPLGAQSLQRQWIKTYSLQPTQTNRASHITLTPDGNIIVAGTSHNGANTADYFAIKYNPAGETLWTFRFDNPESTNDILTAITLDPAGNLFLTGTTETIKVNPAGQLVWASPFPARSIVANTDYVYITGAAAGDISTTQLENNDTNGRDLWTRTFDGPNSFGDYDDRGDVVALDLAGNVYVADQKTVWFDPRDQYRETRFAVLRYSPAGQQIWHGKSILNYGSGVEARSLLIAGDGSVYLFGQFGLGDGSFKFSGSGSRLWVLPAFPLSTSGTSQALDKTTGFAFATGRQYSSSNAGQMGIAKISPAGERVWWNHYSPPGPSEGRAVALDSEKNIYVTGWSWNTPTEIALFLDKRDQNGNQIGLDRYNSPHGGSDFGEAMAIDTNGNVYVTGYSTFVDGANNGGSEFLTIKYSAAPKIEKKETGAMSLQFHTSPGQPYAIEATTNFQTWTSLTTNIADINGIIRFEDTNAATIPYRFYRGNSAP